MDMAMKLLSPKQVENFLTSRVATSSSSLFDTYSLFNYAFSVTQNVTSNQIIIGEEKIGKHMEERGRGLI
jgi:hypothetical protein